MKVASVHPDAVAQSWDLVMVGTPDLADVKLRALLFLLTVSAPEDTGPGRGECCTLMRWMSHRLRAEGAGSQRPELGSECKIFSWKPAISQSLRIQ